MPTPTITRERMSESRRARGGRGVGYHNLTGVDPEARTAACDICGPEARIRKHGQGWRCAQRGVEQSAEWQQRNRERALQHKRDSYRRNLDTRWRQRLATYGLTVEDFDEMIVRQAGLCPICEGQLASLAIDHCHETGVVRGLLCTNCNSGLGMLGDNLKRLLAAVAYLEGV